jgi:hypothetical protein
MTLPISLCIPTMDRWSFLSVNLPKYLDNPYIDEIIITDENGNDAQKIKETFTDAKLKVFVNESRLGPFFNKRKAASLATNTIVCLMDSDNFAPISYFEAFYKFLEENPFHESFIYAPSFTFPHTNFPGFDFHNLEEIIIYKVNYKDIYSANPTPFNTGNYIFSKFLNDTYTLTDDEVTLAKNSWAVDVLYNNYLLMTKADAKIIVVPDMGYEHIVHDGSMYLQTSNRVNLEFYHSLYT